jgi:hypothetical protein
MLYPPPPGKERPRSRSRDPAKGKGPEIGPSGSSPTPEHIPEAATVEEQPRRLRKRLRRPASRGEETGTIPVVQFQATRPPRQTTLRVVLIVGVEPAAPAPESTAVRQAEPKVEAEPAAKPEPEPEPLIVPELESGATTVKVEAEATELQIRTWNLGERIPIVPQI